MSEIPCPICRVTGGRHKMDCQNADYVRAELEAEAEINHKLIVRQSDLLTGVANALRGGPGELELHSHHDLPERAATAKSNEDIMRKQLAALKRLLKRAIKFGTDNAWWQEVKGLLQGEGDE